MAHRKVSDRGKSSIVPLIVVSVIVLGLGDAVAVMFGGDGGGIGGGRNQSARQTATLSNAKQVALTMLMYASDYDVRFPIGLTNQRAFERATMPYSRNASIFRSLNPAGGILGPNQNLSGVPAAGLVDSEATVMVFETYDWPDSRRAVAFTDGHAKFIQGFNNSTDLLVELSETAQKTMDEMALEQKARVSAPPATGPLGMPGG